MDMIDSNPIDDINDAVEETEENAELAQLAASAALASATAAYDSAELSAKVDVMYGELASINANILGVRGLVEQVLAHNEPTEIVVNVDSDDDSGDVDDSEPEPEPEPEPEITDSEIESETVVEQPELAPIELPKSKRGLRKNRRRR